MSFVQKICDPWLKLGSALFLLMAVLYFSNLALEETRFSVEEFTDQVQASNMEVSISGRTFSQEERAEIVEDVQAYFETRSFKFSIDHEIDGDFRVGSARVIAVKDDYPFANWLKNFGQEKLKHGEALVDPAFAFELSLKIGDEFMLAGNSYKYVGELIGLPHGYLSHEVSGPNILILDQPEISTTLAQRDPNSVDKIHLAIANDLTSFQDSLEEKIDVSEMSFVQSSEAHNTRFEKLAIVQTMAEIVAAVVLVCVFLLLLGAMKWAKFTIPFENIKTRSHPLWKYVWTIAAAAFTLGLCAILADYYTGYSTSLRAFELSLIYFIVVVLLAGVEFCIKTVKVLFGYAWVGQIALIGILYLIDLFGGTVTSITYASLLIFAILLMSFHIARMSPARFRDFIDVQILTVASVAIVCAVTFGVLLEGSQRLHNAPAPKSALTVFQLSETAIEQMPALLESEGITAPENQHLIVAQISAINGHNLEGNLSIPLANSLWITTTDRALPKVDVVAGSWWSVFSSEHYIAMSKEFSEQLDVKVGDKITLFVKGVEIVVELRAIFSKQASPASPFANIMGSATILEDFPSTSYVTVPVGDDRLEPLVSRIATQLPEAALMSNKSEIWADNVMTKKALALLAQFEWTYGAALLALSFIVAIAVPKLSILDEWQNSFNAWRENIKLLVPFTIGIGIFYAISMLLIYLAGALGSGRYFGASDSLISLTTWIGAALFTIIFFTITAFIQYIHEFLCSKNEDIADFS